MRQPTDLIEPSTATGRRITEAFRPTGVYLDTGSMGLPPQAVVDAMTADIASWQAGAARAPDYDEQVNRSRALFASLVGVDSADVAIGSTVSALVGLVATALPDGAEVVLPQGDFTSVIFPFAAQAHRGVRVRTAPLEHLADAVTPTTTLVALSVVQSADGRVADLDRLTDAARSHGAWTFVDATQAAGWLPLDAGRVDFLAAAAYKWLLAPRGSAFLAVRPEHRDRLVPLAAGWYAGDDVWSSIYGLPLRLATDARRFDVSPSWSTWVGTAAALAFITDVGIPIIHRHDVALANLLREDLGLPRAESAIVSIASPSRGSDTAAVPQDAAAAHADHADHAGHGGHALDIAAALERHGVRASVRGGAVRLCFHLYNTVRDVEAASEALREAVRPE